MDTATLTLIATVLIFLISQLIGNLIILMRFSNRLTRVETHIIHLMKKHGMTVRDEEREQWEIS